MKHLGLGENIGLGQIFLVLVKILGSGEILCFGENFGFGQQIWVWAKIFGSSENFRFLFLGKNITFG